jgi:hypothetical protein
MAFTDFSTELEAINEMLTMAEYHPISSMSDVPNVPEAQRAQEVLQRTSRQFQGLGHSFNQEDDIEINLNEIGGVFIPENVLRIDGYNNFNRRDLTTRSGMLYDKDDHTFVLGDPGTAIKVTVVFRLALEDLPEHARRYLTLMAMRIFLSKVHSDIQLIQMMKEQEIEAKNAFNAAEFADGDFNMLDSYDSGSIFNSYEEY